MVLAIIGGMHTHHLCFLRYHEPAAPINVARLPNTTSSGMAPQSRLESRHPANSPGCRRKERQYAKRLRDSELDRAEADGREYHGKRHIDGCNHGPLGQSVQFPVVLSHILLSPLVLF